MKLRKFLAATIAVLSLGAVSSCSTTDYSGPQTSVAVIDNSALVFDANGVWEKWNEAGASNVLSVNGIVYSREVNKAYNSFTGFQPSQSREMIVSESYWPDHQWGVVDKSTSSTERYTFLVGYWNSTESTAIQPQSPSCRLSVAGVNTFVPRYLILGNSAVTYTAMTQGLYSARKLQEGDKVSLLIYGVKDGIRTEPVELVLGQCSNGSTTVVDSWQTVDVRALGEVEYIYFQMTSTDTGEYGINTPTYFCFYGMQFDWTY